MEDYILSTPKSAIPFNQRLPSVSASSVGRLYKGISSTQHPLNYHSARHDPNKYIISKYVSPTASMSFMDGQSLPIRLSVKEIKSLKIPSNFFSTTLTMLHRADPCSRFIACVSGPAQTSGAIPWHIQYQVTDVDDFDALKLEDSKFSSVDKNDCGRVEVMLQRGVPTAASPNTSWHGPKPFSEDGSVELKYSQLRGFETSYSLGQYPVRFEKAYNASGRRLTIPTDHPTGSVDIVARLIVGVDDIATLMADMAVKLAEMDAREPNTTVAMSQSERDAAEQDRAMHETVTGLVNE